jgi:hypothetical protein
MRPPPRTRFACTFLALAAACGGPKPAAQTAESTQAAQVEAPAVDIRALLAAEIEPQALQPVAAADGSFKATLEASSPPEVIPKDGLTMVQAELGAGPMLCFVYLDIRDIGELVGQAAQTSFDDGTRHEWVDVHGDQVEGSGYVIGRAHYLGDENKLGDLKVGAAASSQATLLCMHDGPGQYASFERVLRGFISTLEVAAPQEPVPLGRTITRAQIPGKMVTITRTFALNQGKERVNHSYSATLALGAKGELAVAEDGSMETFEKGTLKSGRYISADGGQLKYQIALERDEKSYKISGTVENKPMASEFPVDPAGFLDEERRSAQICKVRDGKLPRFAMVDYDPDSDPLGPSTGIYEKNDTADGELKLRIEGQTDGAEVFLKLDDACDPAGGTVKAHGVTVQVERLFHEKAKS